MLQLSLGAALQYSPNSVQCSYLPQTHHLNHRHSHQSVSHITGQWGSCRNVTDVCEEIMVLHCKAHVLYLTYTKPQSYCSTHLSAKNDWFWFWFSFWPQKYQPWIHVVAKKSLSKYLYSTSKKKWRKHSENQPLNYFCLTKILCQQHIIAALVPEDQKENFGYGFINFLLAVYSCFC